MGYLARSKVSIVIPRWKEVPEKTKDLIWQEIQDMWEVPNNEKTKKQMLSYASERWKDFKTTLTRKYVFGSGDKEGCRNPCTKYNFISEDQWNEFVKSRMDTDFQKTREKAKAINAKNIYPHTLSRGGYDKLKKDEMSRRLKVLEEAAGADEPSLDQVEEPDWFELWTLGRKTSSGSYTSEAVADVASKIESLVEAQTQGSFCSKGQKDILTAAIGTPEHPGRVRTAGRGVGLTKVFGRQRNQSKEKQREAMKEEIKEEIVKEVSQLFQAQFQAQFQELKAQMVANTVQQNERSLEHASTRETVRISTKGSCSPESEEDETDVLRCMGHMAFDLSTGNISLPLDHDPEISHFYLFAKDLADMSLREDFWCANQHLQMWSAYIHHLCVHNETSDIYHILDPSMMIVSNKQTSLQVQGYIQRKIYDFSNKEVFLGSYIHDSHWQLFLICPITNMIVWICSLHTGPNKFIKSILDRVMEKYNSEIRGTNKMKHVWKEIHGPKQNNKWACDFYVMKAMLEIVTRRVTSEWDLLFRNHTAPYTYLEIIEIREIWAKFFLAKIEEINLESSRPRRRRKPRH